MPTLWTIGHSTHSSEDFLALLTAHRISRIVDVRRFPGSRRYPHFGSDALGKSLTDAKVGYQHMPTLGGRRTAQPDSRNDGWKNAGFRGYADYMQTEEFQRAIDELRADATQARTAIMCAEAVPWRCHRSLIADALVTQGWEVAHIMSMGQAQVHRVTAFAVRQGDRLVYPAPADQDAPPRLF
ncbi:MAG: DUF488 domain-containing protein [Nitrospira sp.]|nr:DUF488 domain-containing protein [Nitrospira sp.]